MIQAKQLVDLLVEDEDDDFDPEEVVKGDIWFDRLAQKHGLKHDPFDPSSSKYFSLVIPLPSPIPVTRYRKVHEITCTYFTGFAMDCFRNDSDAMGVVDFYATLRFGKLREWHGFEDVAKKDYKIKYAKIQMDKAEEVIDHVFTAVKQACGTPANSMDDIMSRIRSGLGRYVNYVSYWKYNKKEMRDNYAYPLPEIKGVDRLESDP